MLKCDPHFKTQYAFINGNKIHIQDSKKNIGTPLCHKQHELVFVNGEKRKPYFRHKNSSDTYYSNITQWHLDWQEHFPETEIEFKKCTNQISLRRADIVLNEDTIIEIQHSSIDKKSVEERKHDYSQHNKSIVWIIDGNTGINVTFLNNANRVYLEFQEYWKFESFITYENVYYDIDHKIYKVNPSLIKSKMIDVEQPVDKDYFISCVLEGNFNLWKDEKITQSNLYVKQLGAGNGKTYEAVRLPIQPDFQHYKYFIYLTKQHSAKTVIKQELDILDNECEVIQEHIQDDKKYLYTLKTGQKVIIATLDSFIFSIADKTKVVENTNLFEAYVNRIIDGKYIIHPNGKTKFATFNPCINKETIIILDETQDLSDNYARALLKIMRDKYIDLYVIGDQLQSLSIEENAFVYFKHYEFSYIKKSYFPPLNVCRRFKHTHIRDFVNSIINFSKYNLPQIELYQEDNSKGGYECGIYDIEQIIEKYKYEVNTYNRLPEDFLFVTPILKKNSVFEDIQTAINQFWLDKFQDETYIENVLNKNEYWRNNTDTNIYRNYAVFHKSEEGTSINLDDSEHATRMVSIHSSKGDGRNVVFVIGLSEGKLNCFGKTDSLVYNSLIHVALTRAKEKMYVCLEDKHDGIFYKFVSNTDNIENMKFPNVSENIKYAIDFECDDNLKNVLSKFSLDNTSENKKIIDMSHHYIRFWCIYINVFTNIKDNKKQSIALFHNVKNASVKIVDNYKDFKKLLKLNNQKHRERNRVIPVYNFGENKKDYKTYLDILCKYIPFLQEKVKRYLRFEKVKFCPIESIILSYMIMCVEDGVYTDFSINSLYDLVDKYYKNYNHNHENCLCNSLFPCNYKPSNLTLDDYICHHYDKMKIIDYQLDKVNEKYPDLDWLNLYKLNYKGETNAFYINKKFNFIGYNDKHVIITYIKPSFSELNFNEFVLETFFDTFLNDKEFFANKTIVSIAFSTERQEAYIIEHPVYDKSLVRPYLEKMILKKYEPYFKAVYLFFKSIKNKCDTERNLKNFLENDGVLEQEVKKNKNIPSFISRFFFEVIRGDYKKLKKEEKRNFIEQYLDEKFFIDKLKSEFEDTVRNFFEEEDDDF